MKHITTTLGLLSLGLLSLSLAGPTWAAPKTKEESLQKCQETAQKEAQKYDQAQTKALDNCLKSASKQLRVGGMSAPDAKVAALCAANMQKVEDSRGLGKSAAEKLDSKIKMACDPEVNSNLKHSVDDVTGKGSPGVDKPINTKNSEDFCSPYIGKSTIDNVDDWVQCQKNAHDTAGIIKQATKMPEVSNLLGELQQAINDIANPKNSNLKDDANARIDKLRNIIDVDQDGNADLVCSNPPPG